MVIDGVKAKGVYVAPRRAAYKIRFELPDKPNIVKLTTCHREETFRDTGKKLEYEYKPVVGLEDRGSCLLELGAFDDEGAHAWGLIDFVDQETLKASIGCNGEKVNALGVSICQSKAGLLQTISFESAVQVFSNDPCPKMETKDGLNFIYQMAEDKCLYLFTDKQSEHRLTTFGYQEVLFK